MSTLRIHQSDDLVVALRDLEAGDTVDAGGGLQITLAERIPIKHKFARRRIAEDETVRMYGVVVGRATREIPPGALISRGNLAHAAGEIRIRDGGPRRWKAPDISRWRERTFDGFVRSDGGVGTANVWLVVPLVFCENRNLALMRDALLRPLGYAMAPPYEAFAARVVASCRRVGGAGEAAERAGVSDVSGERPAPVFPNVDGVKFLSHTLGCGGTDADSATLCGLLAGYITHPNCAGATVLSLGCQKAEIRMLEDAIADRAPSFDRPVKIFEQQKAASARDMMADAIRETIAGIAAADRHRRSAAPLSKLVLGMECGGSDGFSGITANPVMGGVADRVVAFGGRVILSEFPELCGAEQDIVDRCAERETADRFLALMRAYAAAAERSGSGFDANPSPGNVADGLITDAMKSAGAARKGGTSPVVDVLDYPEPLRRDGLSLLCTPGGDVESTTAMAGSGATVMLFSTGLGTPTGNAAAPVIKVSTNSKLAADHPDMIDFNCGAAAEGAAGIDELADALLDLTVEVASGRQSTCATRLGQDDFIPWKRGVSL